MVDIPTADKAVASKTTALLYTGEGMVAIDLAPLEGELTECGELDNNSLVRCIVYWLAVRCKLGYEFVKHITEVSTPLDAINWKVVEWLIRAIRTYTGTCVNH